jgi:serine/threonine protein kinase
LSSVFVFTAGKLIGFADFTNGTFQSTSRLANRADIIRFRRRMDKELQYELLEKVASGQQSVYKAKDKTGRLVSVKAAPTATLTPDMRERFLREVHICSSFDHPNLLKVEDSGETTETIYQVTEWLEGMTLAELLKQKLVVSWDQKLGIMEQVCAGLEYAHSKNILHRDVKPSNIFLESSGRVKLLDFGMARTQESNLTVAGLSPGTLTYMSPEQVRGEQVAEASDIFCAGIVFYELATGIHPFAAPGSNVGAVLSAILFQSPTPLKQIAPDAPDGLDIILNQALEKDPARRYSSARELRQTISVCRTLRSAGGLNVPAGGDIDAGKTVIIKRPKPEAGAEPPRPAFQRVPTPPPLQQKFCPYCTSPNKLDATVCANCAMPMGEVVTPAAEPAKPTNWVLILSVLAVVLLAAVVVALLRPNS